MSVSPLFQKVKIMKINIVLALMLTATACIGSTTIAADEAKEAAAVAK
jgi:hypothetical protein